MSPESLERKANRLRSDESDELDRCRLGVSCRVTLEEGQSLHFVLREPPKPETSGEASEVDCESARFLSLSVSII